MMSERNHLMNLLQWILTVWMVMYRNVHDGSDILSLKFQKYILVAMSSKGSEISFSSHLMCRNLNV